jgi:hypothetical protein
MKLIPLSQNKFAQVDDDLFDYLSQWKWFFDGDYARRHVYEYKNGKKIQKNIQMHRLVNKTPKGKFTDHIDGNPLNNQRANLRTCTIRQNGANMKKQPNKSSIYKGVSKDGNIYRTVIWKNNEKVFAASSRNERWAAMIYDLNAAPLFGEFARLNFPEAILVVRE